MTELPHILLVDDDPFTFQLERKLLGEQHYRFSTAQDGTDCLVKVEVDKPDIILLDIMMPNMDGLETCRRLRARPDGSTFYIIFVSSQNTPEARLQAYDMGADDFLVKPLSSEELSRKVQLAQRHLQEMEALRRSASDSMNMAMTAMTASGEQGVVLHFFGRAFTCQSIEALVRVSLDALGQFGLSASVQLRTEDDMITMNSAGRCSLIEQELLTGLCIDNTRLSDYGSRTVVCFPHVTILVKNMPEDADRHGRMRDNLALLAEGIEYRMLALINELKIRKRQQRLAATVRLSQQAMGDIDVHYKRNQSEMSQVLTDLERKVETAFSGMDLTESQESHFLGLLRPVSKRAAQLYDDGLKLDERLQSVLTSLQEALKD